MYRAFVFNLCEILKQGVGLNYFLRLGLKVHKCIMLSKLVLVFIIVP